MSNMKRRDPFQAIADPTRRAIIGLLANETMNLNSVAEKFNVSRPAISKHIKILTQCGLIEIRQKGRERFCEARLESLNLVEDWMKDYRRFWDTTMVVAVAPTEKAEVVAVEALESVVVAEEIIVAAAPVVQIPAEVLSVEVPLTEEVSTIGMPEEEVPFDEHEYEQFLKAVSSGDTTISETAQEEHDAEESQIETQSMEVPVAVIQAEEAAISVETEIATEEHTPIVQTPAEDAQVSQSIKHVIERKQVEKKPKEKKAVQEAPTLQISLF
jgi:DNA-binding transcriptional ArsR family regulator